MQPIQFRSKELSIPYPPPLGLYIHLPWCLQKCLYCDFNSHAIKNAQSIPQERYIHCLIQDLISELPRVWGRKVHSVFIGGGTPSLFGAEWIDQLLGAVRSLLPLTPHCEITLEANPGAVDMPHFADYRQAGVNRISLGVQTFNDALLGVLGRVHNSQQAIQAIERVQYIFDNWNVDLMYALPQQTLEDWQKDLHIIRHFAPKHLSVYQLTLEENTPFAKVPPQRIPDEDEAFRFYEYTLEFLPSWGLERYEISAFSQPDWHCRHNLNYWQFGDYLAIGAGAHSKLTLQHQILRQVRYSNPQKYMQQVAQTGSGIEQDQWVKKEELAFEFMLNACRLTRGFTSQLFTERTGLSIADIDEPLQQAHKLGLIQQQGNLFKPTSQGLNFSNELLAIFLP
ncbi:MAG: radical SAM family heme chaperone HemW [Gammaproteobacteria bacterium]|nr:radical SAM family heme chaperone HemW [Gammaproteobacteria bacterium]